MTRFARAKGSKASNERVLADHTPWHEMKNDMLKKKQEIEEEKSRREAEAKRNENYQKFLKEREEEATKQTVWAEFPEENGPKLNGVSTKSKTIKKQKNVVKEAKMKKKAALAMKNGTIEKSDQNSEVCDGSETSEKKMKKKKLKIIQYTEEEKMSIEQNNSVEGVKKSKKPKHTKPSQEDEVQDSINAVKDDDDSPMEISSKVEETKPVIKQVKKKKVKTVIANKDLKKSKDQEIMGNVEKGKKKKLDKQGKTANDGTTDVEQEKNDSKKQQRKVIDLDSLPEDAKKKILKKQEKRRKQVEKKKLKKKEKLQENEDSGVANSESSEKTKIPEKKKFIKPTENFDKSTTVHKKESEKEKILKKKKFESGEIKRRKDFKQNTIIVNGNEVELEYFEGFPIKKEDAINLWKLKKEMISKGLPRSEINRTLKLERRKAEKALAREKKKVCYNCRKFGHNLSECPILSNKDELVSTSGDGLCFKCGSTEHTSFACRVVRGENFKFATCFICKEQGHISRQCPDNARGLYPKGGCCRVCGDVTHLKKDCPQYQEEQKKEEAKFQVETIFDGNPDDLVQRNGMPKTTQTTTKMKVIKF